jgi:hypothetical protein
MRHGFLLMTLGLVSYVNILLTKNSLANYEACTNHCCHFRKTAFLKAYSVYLFRIESFVIAVG